MTHNFIGGKWEEVELGERNRILFPEEEILAANGRKAKRGAQNFGNPWDVNVSEGEMLEKILGRVGRVRSSYTGESLGRKGLSARQTTGFI